VPLSPANRIAPPLAIAALLLGACGGPVGASPPIRADASPVLGTLAGGDGQGTARLRAGDLAGARALYESELGQDPDRLAALNDLAVSYYLDGRFEAARQLLDEVVARGGAPEQQAALVNLGELYALEGYVSAAQAHFETARGIDPSRPGPLYALALLADSRGEPAASLGLVREALRLDAGGAGRAALAFVYPEERLHLEALVGEALGDRDLSAARWRQLEGGRFAALSAAAERHLEEP
jgi:tetratricopeptide (TPR) repeat protein